MTLITPDILTRFAPSPTGYLHLGHARAAAEAFGFARERGGQCLLRIEDIDHTRCHARFTDAIYEDLHWLGFEWPDPVRVQSAHLTDYDDALDRLKSKGLLYRCFKTRKQVEALSDGGVYFGGPDPDEISRLARAEPFAWRLDMGAALLTLGLQAKDLGYQELGINTGWTPADPARHGDIILARKDIGTSYHIAVTHDDAAQGITHVVRGADLKDQTDIHVLLQALLDWPTPTYLHHSLVRDEDGEKLAKRRGDTSIRHLRESGVSPEQVLALARA